MEHSRLFSFSCHPSQKSGGIGKLCYNVQNHFRLEEKTEFGRKKEKGPRKIMKIRTWGIALLTAALFLGGCTKEVKDQGDAEVEKNLANPKSMEAVIVDIEPVESYIDYGSSYFRVFKTLETFESDNKRYSGSCLFEVDEGDEGVQGAVAYNIKQNTTIENLLENTKADREENTSGGLLTVEEGTLQNDKGSEVTYLYVESKLVSEAASAGAREPKACYLYLWTDFANGDVMEVMVLWFYENVTLNPASYICLLDSDAIYMGVEGKTEEFIQADEEAEAAAEAAKREEAVFTADERYFSPEEFYDAAAAIQISLEAAYSIKDKYGLYDSYYIFHITCEDKSEKMQTFLEDLEFELYQDGELLFKDYNFTHISEELSYWQESEELRELTSPVIKVRLNSLYNTTENNYFYEDCCAEISVSLTPSLTYTEGTSLKPGQYSVANGRFISTGEWTYKELGPYEGWINGFLRGDDIYGFPKYDVVYYDSYGNPIEETISGLDRTDYDNRDEWDKNTVYSDESSFDRLNITYHSDVDKKKLPAYCKFTSNGVEYTLYFDLEEITVTEE